MTILFLIGALGLGRLILNTLRVTWHRFEAWALIVLFGSFFGAWLLLLACAAFGFSAGAIITIILMLASWILPQTRRPLSLSSFTTARQTGLWLITTGAFSLIISYLLYRQMLEPGPGGAYSEGGASADLPLHLCIMSHVAYATRFDWHFSLMAHTYLTYPFLIDFLSGMIVRWGGSLRLGLLLTSIPLCVALVQLLFFLGYRALKSVRTAALFTTLFFLNGSCGGVIQMLIDYFHSKSSLWSFLSNPPLDYTDITFYRFGNFITTILMPQRGFQFGLSIFCAVMLLVYQLAQEKDIRLRRRILLLIGSLIGLLPLAHVHSFLMIMAVLIVLAVFDRKTIKFQEWLLAIVTGIAIALPQLAYQLFANHHASFVRFAPGWLFYDGIFPSLSHYQALFVYILANFGIVLALVILSYRHLKSFEGVRRLVLLGGAFFVTAFLYIFQPSAYDNIKFFIYAYLFFCLAIAHYLTLLSRAGRWLWVPLTLLFVAAGTLSVIWQARNQILVYPDSALAEAKEMRRQLPINALVLTADYFRHPLWALDGQPVVEGQSDFLSTYGLPVRQLGKDVHVMYAGRGDALRLLEKYRIQYVLISPYERLYVGIVNEPFFIQHFPVVYQHNGVDIYQIRRTASEERGLSSASRNVSAASAPGRPGDTVK